MKRALTLLTALLLTPLVSSHAATNSPRVFPFPDVAAANTIWINDGSGRFRDSGQSLGRSHTESVDLGDVDGDGDLDAFVVDRDREPKIVWMNDGTGIFLDSGELPTTYHGSVRPARK